MCTHVVALSVQYLSTGRMRIYTEKKELILFYRQETNTSNSSPSLLLEVLPHTYILLRKTRQ